MKKHTKRYLTLLTGLLALTFLTVTGCQNQANQSSSTQYSEFRFRHKQAYQSEHQISESSSQSDRQGRNINTNEIGGLNQNQYNQLAGMNFKSGSKPVINVNGGKSTLNPQSWTQDRVIYQNLDSLNRASGSNTAFIDKRNLANSKNRTVQYVKPTGWHQKFINNQAIINRGHIIAYSLTGGINQDGRYVGSDTGNQNDLKNLFTQTAFSNQDVQTKYEQMVRNALYNGKKVVYQGTPIFQGNDLMPKGINLQAVSTDGSLNFNVYLFNVQPNVSFDYATGRSGINRGMQVNWHQSYRDF